MRANARLAEGSSVANCSDADFRLPPGWFYLTGGDVCVGGGCKLSKEVVSPEAFAVYDLIVTESHFKSQGQMDFKMGVIVGACQVRK